MRLLHTGDAGEPQRVPRDLQRVAGALVQFADQREVPGGVVHNVIGPE